MTKIKTKIKAAIKDKPVPVILGKCRNLSLANVTTDGVTVDDFDRDGYEIVLPTITLAIIKDNDYARKVIAEKTTQAEWDALDEETREDYIKAFHQTDGYDQWRDGFDPMMLCYWPVHIYDKDTGEIADLLEELSIACSLLEITGDALREVVGEDHAIVLSGGGMNLCDHLVAAYLACENVPPTSLLTGLTGVIDKRRLAQIGPRLKQAFAQAESWTQNEAARLKRDRCALFNGKRPGIGL